MSFRSGRTIPIFRVARFLAVVFFFLSFFSIVESQTFRGGINGTVTDQSGAALPNAQVKSTNDGTGTIHVTTSSSAGEYAFQDLPLGTYSVEVTASGFQTLRVSKIPVAAGTIYSLPLKLSVAQAATTVEVDAAGIALDTTSTTQTTVITAKSVSDIPLNGRDFTQMLVLTPGFANSGAGGYGSLNGTRANQMNWQIDGIDNNDLWHNIPAVNQGGVSGIAGIVLPIDAVDQFSAQTQASPESGRNPGGTINLALKAGTNQLHGSAYYFNRNEFFGAKSPFTTTKQKVRNYNWGFSAGGPIVKDKFFGFITFEKQRFVIGLPGLATEPSAAYQAKAKAVLAANKVAVNPVSTALLATLWPSYALTGPAAVNNYNSPDPEFGYSYNGLAKLDYTLNERNSFSFHWFAGQGNQVAPVGSELLSYYEVAPIHVQNYALVYNHVFTPSLTNQVLMGVNYFNQVFNDNDTHFNVASLGFVTGSPYLGSPNIKITGFDPIGMTPPEGRNDITGHLTDDLSWTVGKHQFKFGGEWRQAQLDEFYHRHALGTFKFDGSQGPGSGKAWNSGDSRVDALADFLAGNVASSSIALGDPSRQVFVNTFAIFAQDAWQLTPKFNLNYGVRWDYEGPLHNDYKNLSVFRPSLGGIVFQGAGISSVYDPTYTNLSPRVGFSYQAQSKTVVRGGVGLFFDTPNLNPFLDNRPGNNAPNGLEGNPAGSNPVYNLSQSAYTIASGKQIFSSVNPCQVTKTNVQPCGVFSIAKNFRPSFNTNYNLQVEQGLTDKVVAQLGYVGSEGRHLLSIRDLNQAALQSGGSPNTTAEAYAQQASRPYFSQFPTFGNINEIQSIGNSNYNSLQATLRLSNWHRLTAQAAYTWSHNFDEVTAYRGALPQDSNNFRGDYGNSDFDTRNTYVGLISYEIPGLQNHKLLTQGWQVNSLMTFHTGLPFSVFSTFDNSGTDEGVQRANQVGDPYAGAKIAKPNANWLNPAAFADPAPGQFGTSRRNAYYAPGFSDVDFSFFKSTPITEKVTTQFRAEMFNLFNRTNFAPPVSNFNPSYTTNGSFTLYDTIGDFNGAPGIGAGEPFNMQLGLKILF